MNSQPSPRSAQTAQELWAREADERVRYGKGFHWVESPLVMAYIQKQITDDPSLDWLTYSYRKYLAPNKPNEIRLLSLGCGGGVLERGLCRLGFEGQIDAFDFSEGAITHARTAAAEEGLRNINYFVSDLNHAQFPREEYDVVYCSGALHHISHLEHLLDQVRETLSEHGLLIINEYVGRFQLQWTPQQTKIIDELLHLMPVKYRRRISAPGQLKDGFLGPSPIREMDANDASESVRSDEIVDLIRARFSIKEQKNFGGTILHMLLQDIVGNFDPADAMDAGFLNMLIYIEQLLIREKVLGSDFVFLVAEKSGARRVEGPPSEHSIDLASELRARDIRIQSMNERLWQWAEYTRSLESRLQETLSMSSGLSSCEVTPAKSDFESLRRHISAAEVRQNEVGAVNPRPPGLHNYLIQCSKKTISRILTWYTRPIIEYNARVTESLSDVTRCLEAHENQIASILQRGSTTKPHPSERATSPGQNNTVDNDYLNVIRDISPQDGMFAGNVDHYFDVGFSALHCIRIALNAAGKQTCKKILDLPCGHGRVLRTLKGAFPQAQLTACDLLHDGVDFCAQVFGATPIYADENPARMMIPGPFDLVWSGSLLTHLNKDRWDGFLSLFESLLSQGGVLVFTVHGRRSVQLLRNGACDYGFERPAALELLGRYEQEGFGYLDYPNTKHYGISISSPSWVLSQLASHPGLRLLTYMEQGWDNHQDTVACLRV